MRKAILHLKKADPVLGALIGRIGPYRIEYREPRFETLVRSVVYQQLSGKVARVIFDRLAGAAGDGEMTPASILRLTPQRMRKLGLSQQKTSYIRDLAAKARDRQVDFDALPAMPDDAIIESLTRVKGIGVWTVQMFLIFALRRPDVMPSADLGIRKAVHLAYGLAEMPRPAEVDRLSLPWRPFCSVASWYLWRSLEDNAGL